VRLLRLPLPALSPGPRVLGGPKARYLVRVLRLGPGDRLTVFDPSTGAEAEAAVVSAAAGAATISVGPLREGAVRSHAPITWIHGLAKGDKCDAIVRDATELGATRIVFAPCGRSVVRLDAGRARARAERWRQIAAEAARQSLRADAPTIELLDWAAALASVAPKDARIVLDPRAPLPLADALGGALGGGVAFAAGPEGGLTEAEVGAAHAAGFEGATLGPRVLRTETVPAAVLGAWLVLGAK
jgi:16S rRNA (uracil1498-N3)-methyltransferase